MGEASAVAADVGTENGAGQVENKDTMGLREGVDTGGEGREESRKS